MNRFDYDRLREKSVDELGRMLAMGYKGEEFNCIMRVYNEKKRMIENGR